MKRVVVTGMGVVSPIGTSIPAFFDGLRTARPGIGEIISFDAETFPTRIAGEVGQKPDLPQWVDEMILPAILRDPKSCFALAAAEECLKDAFGDEEPSQFHNPDRICAYIATGLEILHLQDLVRHAGVNTLDGASILQSVMDFPPWSRIQTPSHLAARAIAKRIKAHGRFIVNVSACAAGTQALGEAFLAIQDGAADMAVTGGYDSMINPLGVGGFCMLEALSTSNHLGGAASRPFDADRDGFVLGEGSGMCVLEEYEAARSRGAKIYAEVLGYASSLDAYRVSDPDPEQRGAVKVMDLALKRARFLPDGIDYINVHGTATRKNDPNEARAIRRVFGKSTETIPVSSTKSQIGHLIGAAGAVEFIVGVFALKEGIIPATINLDHPDSECKLNHVAKTPRKAQVRSFLSNSFGFGGQNAAIIVGAVD